MKSGVIGSAVAAGMLAMSGIAYAGRPMAIDDADPVDPGLCEFEAGAAYDQAPGCKHWDIPFGLTYGLVQGVEVGAGFGGQMEERTELLDERGTEDHVCEKGIGDLMIGAKWQFTESWPAKTRQALAAGVKLPTADEANGLGSGETDSDLTWIASRAIGEKTGIHLNLGYSLIGGEDSDVLHYGAAVDYQLANEIQWVGEIFAEKELAGGTDTVALFNTGLRWNPSDSVTLDIAGGSGFSDDGPDFMATVGLTWTFGFGNTEGK